MNALRFTPDTKIIDHLKDGHFTLSSEIVPPRNGVEVEKVYEQVSVLKEANTDFFSVTKGAGGSLRAGSLPITQLIKENFHIPCIAHFTCRDLLPHELENQLIDHHYFGVRNILALRGDPPMDNPGWTPKEGTYPYAYQLIEQIKKLNKGDYLSRNVEKDIENRETTDFCIGCAVYPEHPKEQERLEFFKHKVDAGAEYAISQMIFDANKMEDFLNLCAKNNLNIPILPGTRILKTKKQAHIMETRFGCSVPKEIKDKLPETFEGHENQIVDLFSTYIHKLKDLGVPGVHIFVLSDTELSSQLIREVRGSK